MVSVKQQQTQEALQTLSSAISSLDIATVRFYIKPKGKRKGLPPDEFTAHINPVAIGLGMLGLGTTLWVLQLRPKWDVVDRYYGQWIWPSTGEAVDHKMLHWDAKEGTRYIYKDHRGAPPHRTGYWIPEWVEHKTIATGTGTVVGHGLGFSPGAIRYEDVVHPAVWYPSDEDAQWEEFASKTEYGIKVYGIERRKGFLENIAGEGIPFIPGI